MPTSAIEISVTENGKRKPEYTLESDVSGNLTLKELFKFTKNTLLATASTILHEEQAKGFDKKPVVRVDNKYGRTEQDVNPLGQIEYISRGNSKEMLLFCYDAILQRSPRLTGRYHDNNIVLFNEREVASSRAGFEAWLSGQKSFKDKDKIRFVNIAPYANKLELDGTTSSGTSTKRRPIKDKKGRDRIGTLVRKPNGVYTLALRAIRHKYKGNSLIKYEQILGSQYGLSSPPRGSGIGRIRQRGRDKGRTYVYPSILIYIIESGLMQ